MDINTEAEVGFTVWMAQNYAEAKRLYDAGLSWEKLVSLLRYAHAGGMGYGMLAVVEKIDAMEAERDQSP